MIIATLIKQIEFKEEINCEECTMSSYGQCEELWCDVEGRCLVACEENPVTLKGFLEKRYEGPRPDWCPLKINSEEGE